MTSAPSPYPPEYPPTDELLSEQDRIPDDFKYSVDVASCEISIRHMYIRKVYALLTMQIMCTVVVGFFMRYNSSVTNFVFNNVWLLFVSLAGMFGFMIATFVKARSYPINLVLLAGFTLCEAYTVGMCTALVESDVLVHALLLTCIIFIGLTLFAFQTRYDFTSWQSYMGFALWSLVGWGFVMMFFPGSSSTMQKAYSGIGAVIFGIYIIIDTQHILKTAHLDDEVMSALKLYLDVVNLFMHILNLTASLRDD